MTKQKYSVWVAVATCGVGLLLGFSLRGGLWGSSATDEIGKYVRSLQQHAEQLAKIEQTLATLTQAAQGAASASFVSDRRQTTTASASGMLRQEIAQILRDELRSLHVAGNDGNSSSAEESSATEILNTPENIEAYTQAHEVVRVALSTRRWTDEDVEALWQTFAFLTNEQQKEMLQTLIPAMNRGEIAVETSGPPL